MGGLPRREVVGSSRLGQQRPYYADKVVTRSEVPLHPSFVLLGIKVRPRSVTKQSWGFPYLLCAEAWSEAIVFLKKKGIYLSGSQTRKPRHAARISLPEKDLKQV